MDRPPPGVFPNNQPFYVRQRQDWAIGIERQKHIESLYWVGEPVLFVLMWRVEDFQRGLISRCPRCAEIGDSVEARIAEVYKQPQTAKCNWCFGTTFEGGIRAKIVRPAIVTDSDEDERKGTRGVTHAESVSVETTEDFRSRTGDFMFRADGSRWQLGKPTRVMVRTGFQHPTQRADSIGYTLPASREDQSSVAYEIPPSSRTELAALLAAPVRWPYYERDVVMGPLIPDGAGEFE